MALLYLLRRMLQTDTIGSSHDGHKWVFLSAAEAAYELNCNRKTAHDDLKWLADNGFVIREKLGGTARKPDGNKVSLGNRSWFYRLGDKLPSWFMALGNPSPTQRANHRPVTGQSDKEHSKNSLLKKRPGCGKQPNSHERGKGLLDIVQRLTGAHDAPEGIRETDSQYQARMAKENAQRRAREDGIYAKPIPAGTGFGGN